MRMWVPTGYKAMMYKIYGEHYQAEAAASVDIDAGSNLWTITCESDEIPDIRANVPNHEIVPLSNPAIHPYHNVVTGNDETYIAMYHTSINTGANASHSITALILLWQDPTPTGRALS